MNRLVISSNPFLTQAVKIDNGKITVFIIRKKNDYYIVGNVYKGVVDNISKHLGAAFIDIGIGKNAFLCIDQGCSNGFFLNNCKIKVGDEILVQVFKPIVSNKGPKVSTNIAIPGNYIVLLRDSNFIGVSKHIDDSVKINELKNFLNQFSENNVGFIARTASRFATKKELENEIKYLKSVNRKIENRFMSEKAPKLIYEEPRVPIQVIREYCDELTEEIVFDDEKMYKNTKDYFLNTSGKWQDKIRLYKEKKPMFEYYNINSKIKELQSGTIRLKSGGYIIIEKTEALFSIDVNSGSYSFDKEAEDAIFAINKEAAYEIFNQIFLRDMGGLIVVDFIDMKYERHKKELEEIIKKLSRKDRRKIYTSGISQFGLVEISRRKSNQDIFDIMFEKCENCLNNGLVKSTALICSEIYEKILYKYGKDKKLMLYATPVIIEYMKKMALDLNNVKYKETDSCKAEDYTLEVIK